MRLLIFTDCHWSTNTSIVRQRGEKYSIRLELLIKSFNWMFDIFKQNNCDLSICAGDMFDKYFCNDEELSALKEIKWFSETHFIVGNHESTRADLAYTSVDALSGDNIKVFKKSHMFCVDNCQIYYLPYVSEYDRKSLKEYLDNYDSNKKHVIISHNDLKDVQYGKFLSKTGFSLSEIEECADLYLNGHIHNSEWITSKILNLGSLTAQNFTNDSFKYKYGVWILDTETLKLEFFENPYSLNFYKIDVMSDKDLNVFKTLKNNAVISCKCLDTLKEKLQNTLQDMKNLLTYKIIYTKEEVATNGSSEKIQILSKDHLEQFKEYITQVLGLSEIVQQELMEVCK